MTFFRRLTIAAAAGLLACGDTAGPPGPGPLASLTAASGDAQTARAGSPLPEQLVVHAVDDRGNRLAGVQVTIEVVSGSGSVTPSSVMTGADGAAAAVWTLGNEAGAQEVVAYASATGTTRVKARFVATATPGPYARAVVAGGATQSGSAGQPLAEDLAVRAFDAMGNPVAGVEVRFHAATGYGTFAQPMVLTDAMGVARSRWTLGNSALLTRQDAVAVVLDPAGGDTTHLAFSATSAPARVAALNIVAGDSQTVVVYQYVPVIPTVRAVDSAGRSVSGVTVTFTVISGNSNVGPPAVTDSMGLANSLVWWLGSMATDVHRLRARAANGVAEVVFAAFPIPDRDHPATHILSGHQQRALAGETLPEPFIIRVLDRFGNNLEGMTVTWNVLAGGGTPDPPTSVTDEWSRASTTYTVGAGHQRVRPEVPGGNHGPQAVEAFGVVRPTGWARLPENPDGPGGTVAVLNGRIHVLKVPEIPPGSITSPPRRVSHTIFDPVTNRWTRAAPVRYSYPAYSGRGRAVITSAGLHFLWPEAHGTQRHWIYDEALDRWNELPGPMARKSHPGIAVVNDRIYVMGGAELTAGIRALTAIEVYDVAAGTWSVLPALAPPMAPRLNASVAVIGDEIILSGGSDENVTGFLQMTAFNPETRTWRPYGPMADLRTGHALVVINGRLCYTGGSGFFHWCRVPGTDSWEAMGGIMVPERVEGVVVNDVLYLFGASGNERMGPFPP